MNRAGWSVLSVLIALVVSTGPAVAQEAEGLSACPPTTLDDLFPVVNEPVELQEAPTEPACRPFVYPLVYPVSGPSIPIASFGADREGHRHGGNDIAAAAMTPVVAGASGRISWIDDECCSLAIRHNDGWTTWYIHLNNDTFGTDDGLGWGIAPGLEIDGIVQKGDLIGWVGDSGNAEDSQPHLHFEIRTPQDISIDPAASLASARDRPGSEGFSGPFADDDSSPFGNAISTLTSVGLLQACEGNPTSFCPDRPATGAQTAAIIARITDLDMTDVRLARIPEGPWQDALMRAMGIRRDSLAPSACALARFCSDTPITFGDLGTMLRLLPVLADSKTDTLMTVDEFAVGMLEQVEGTDPLRSCAARRTGVVTGGQLAEMVARALGMVGPPPCDQIE